MLLSFIFIMLCPFMVMLCLFYADGMIIFFSCVYINRKTYDSDDIPLTLMLLQRSTEVNAEDGDAEDEYDN